MAEVKKDVFDTPTNAAEFDVKASTQSSIRSDENERNGDETAASVKKVPPKRNAVIKRSVGRRLVDLFFDKDIEDLPEYVLENYVGPGLKDLFYNIIVGTTGQAMYGNRRNDYRDTRGSADYYNSRYNGSWRDSRDDYRDSGRVNEGIGVNDYRDVLLPSRNDAEEVILELKGILYRYGKVSVGDFYQAAGVTCDEFVVNNWGWTNLDGIDCRPVQGGWRVILPRIKRL